MVHQQYRHRLLFARPAQQDAAVCRTDIHSSLSRPSTLSVSIFRRENAFGDGVLGGAVLHPRRCQRIYARLAATAIVCRRHHRVYCGSTRASTRLDYIWKLCATTIVRKMLGVIEAVDLMGCRQNRTDHSRGIWFLSIDIICAATAPSAGQL